MKVLRMWISLRRDVSVDPINANPRFQNFWPFRRACGACFMVCSTCVHVNVSVFAAITLACIGDRSPNFEIDLSIVRQDTRSSRQRENYCN